MGCFERLGWDRAKDIFSGATKPVNYILSKKKLTVISLHIKVDGDLLIFTQLLGE